jgi:hypothetical protein
MKKIINSMVIGLIFGIIIYKLFLQELINKNHHGPDSNDIKKFIYQTGTKYYKFIPQICPCPV